VVTGPEMTLRKPRIIAVRGHGASVTDEVARGLAAQGNRVVLSTWREPGDAGSDGDVGRPGEGQIVIVADRADSGSGMPSFVERAVSEFGGLDGYVDCSLSFLPGAASIDDDLAEVACYIRDRIARSLSYGNLVMRFMRDAGHGRVITVLGEHWQAREDAFWYAAVQGAAAAATLNWAVDMASSTVRVNGVCVGADEPTVARTGLAHIVAYLLSDGAADVHGQLISVGSAKAPAGPASLGLVDSQLMQPPWLKKTSWSSSDVEEAVASTLQHQFSPARPAVR
jgi:NAD(P)-dependent dehydrogenase (short-subunit alcohol dehydrogenase family)